jgi:hypothetical protein
MIDNTQEQVPIRVRRLFFSADDVFLQLGHIQHIQPGIGGGCNRPPGFHDFLERGLAGRRAEAKFFFLRALASHRVDPIQVILGPLHDRQGNDLWHFIGMHPLDCGDQAFIEKLSPGFDDQ